MSKNLVNWLKVFESIARVRDTRKRNTQLKNFSDNLSFFEALKEIAQNTINMNIPLRLNQKKKLRKYSKVIKELAKKKRRTKVIRNKLIKQSGGFLPILIPLVTSVVGELIRNG